jgi:hypothetical protein
MAAGCAISTMQRTAYAYRPRHYLAGDGDPEKNQKKSNETFPSADIPWYSNWGVYLLTIPVLASVILGLIFINSAEDKAQLFVVFTGRLTREMGHPNSYMVTPDNGTEYTRVYYCLMDSGIGSDRCGDKSPVYDYQLCMQSIYDCSSEMHMTWPVDYGFLKCAQNNYNASTGSVNRFLACSRSEEGVMALDFQSPNSDNFLGSYNYVSFLLSALTVMSSFVVASAGGIYRGNIINVSYGHISGFNPLSWGLISVALVWNILAIFFTIGMGAIQKPATSHYPMTLWTSGLILTVFTGATGYFLSFFIEYVHARMNSEGTKEVVPAAANLVTPGTMQPTPGGPQAYPPMYPPGGFPAGFPPGYAPVYPGPQGYPAPPGFYPPNSQSQYNPSHPNTAIQRVGVKPEMPLVAEGDTGHDWKVIAPLMVRTFAWCWVFTDGLFFVGMLNPQSSIINSYAVRVFYGVTLARLFQLVSAYFANQGYINRSVTNESRLSNQVDPKEFGAHMIAIFTYLASIAILADSLYHIGWPMTYYDEALSTRSNYTLFIFFLIAVVTPEVIRMWLLFYEVSFGTPGVGTILATYELIFTWDWIARGILVIVAISYTTTNLHDAQSNLQDYRKLFI